MTRHRGSASYRWWCGRSRTPPAPVGPAAGRGSRDRASRGACFCRPTWSLNCQPSAWGPSLPRHEWHCQIQKQLLATVRRFAAVSQDSTIPDQQRPLNGARVRIFHVWRAQWRWGLGGLFWGTLCVWLGCQWQTLCKSMKKELQPSVMSNKSSFVCTFLQ